jgi:hypothetical protein
MMSGPETRRCQRSVLSLKHLLRRVSADDITIKSILLLLTSIGDTLRTPPPRMALATPASTMICLRHSSDEPLS